MARSKKDCPECCSYTVAINPNNCEFIWEEQNRLKIKKRKHVSVEFVVNKVLAEAAIRKDHII